MLYTAKDIRDKELWTSPITNELLPLFKIYRVLHKIQKNTKAGKLALSEDQVIAYKHYAELTYKFKKQDFINELQNKSEQFFTVPELINNPFHLVFTYNPFERYLKNHIEDPAKYKKPAVYFATFTHMDENNNYVQSTMPIIPGLLLSKKNLMPIFDQPNIYRIFKRLNIEKIGKETLRWYNKMNENYFFLFNAEREFQNDGSLSTICPQDDIDKEPKELVL